MIIRNDERLLSLVFFLKNDFTLVVEFAVEHVCVVTQVSLTGSLAG